MVGITFAQTRKRVVISHSRVTTFMSCAQKFRFANMFTQADSADDSFAAGAGTALHVGIQKYMLTHDLFEARKQMFLAYPFHLYLDGLIRHEPKGRTFGACLAALDHWIESGLGDRYKLVSVNGAPGEELVVEIALGSIGLLDFVYQMHIDLVLEDVFTGKICVRDIKTHDEDTPFDKYAHSKQLLPYAFVVDALMANDDTHKHGMDTISSGYWFARINGNSLMTHEELVEFGPTELADWIHNMRHVCHSIAFQQGFGGQWMKNENTCHSWRRDCPFLDICRASMSERDYAEFFHKLNRGEAQRNDEKPAATLVMNILEHEHV